MLRSRRFGDDEVEQQSRAGPGAAWTPVVPVPDGADRIARALGLWNEGRDPRGTPVERYVTSRGLDLSGIPAGVLRYHPACPFAGSRTPAMLALVRDVVTDEPKAIHRTALSVEGFKVEIDGVARLSLGPIAGGAIKVTADEDVTTGLGVAEGLETGLSLRLAPEFGCSPLWVLVSAGGVGRFPVLAGIECLWIAVDNDANGRGQAAARACAARWHEAGREVFLVEPVIKGDDLNNTVKGRSRDA